MRPETPELAPRGRPSRLLPLVLVILTALVAAATVLVVREVQVRRSVYARVLLERTEGAENEVEGFFGPIRSGLRLLRSWGQSGLLDREDPQALALALEPLLGEIPQASALVLVTSDGRELCLRRSESGRVEPCPEGEGGAARSTEWYRGALRPEESGDPFWTDLEPVEGGGEQATAAVSWDDGGDAHRLHVAALHIPREAVLSLVEAVPLTASGLALLPAEADGSLVWMSVHEGERFESTTLSQVYGESDETSALITDILMDWRRRESPREKALLLRRGDRSWWYLFRTLDESAPRRDLGFVLPRDELDPLVETVTGPLTYFLFGVIAVGAVALIGIAVGYRRRLARLERGAGLVELDETGLRAAIDAGESDRLEFKSTLRWNLRSNKPDRAVETAWLKTVVAFLNSEGGTLLVGVGDDGSAVGAVRDGFRNEDRYLLHVNNLIHKHVGLEFARYLRFDLRPLDAERILVLDVRPAPEPAFLHHEEEEDFYVRVGPSSRRLPLSRTLEYLKERGSRSRPPRD